MTEPIRVGFIGVGNMGQCAHLRHYAALADCQVVALAELRPELARRVAARYGIPRVYAEASEMLDHEDLDAVVAAQPFTRHGQILPEVYRRQVPVLTEKPLAASVEVGEKLVSALLGSGSFHMVAYHKRSDPATMYAKEQIDALKESGRLGELRYVRITMPPGDWIAGGFDELVRTEEPYPDLDQDPPASDLDEQAYSAYVTFVNYYIHQVNLMRHLMGEPYRVRYAAPSGVLLAAESESGVSGVLEMAPYETSVAWQESALVGFERGCIRLDLPAPLTASRPGRVVVMQDPGKGETPIETKPHLPWVGAMRQQAINFLRAVRGEATPPCEAAESLEDLKVAREYLRLWKGV